MITYVKYALQSHEKISNSSTLYVVPFNPLFPPRAVCGFTGVFFCSTDSPRTLPKQLVSQAVPGAEEGLFSV